MPKIELYELAPTRSARVRWVLKEAQLTYTSLGNQVETIGSDAVKQIHPLGKLPAARIWWPGQAPGGGLYMTNG